MDPFETLTRVGFSKKEAAVLAALLDKRLCSLTELNQETHINRPALYSLLPRLVKNGFVSVVKKGRRNFYQAEPIQRIIEQYKITQTETLKELEQLAQEQKDNPAEKPIVKYFDGKHGIRFVFDDIAHTIPHSGTFFRYSARTGADSTAFDNTHYARVRDQKKLQRVVITSADKVEKKVKKLERQMKAVPKNFDLFEDNISLVIYGDKTAYVDYGSNTAFIIESPKIARFQEKLFRLLYRKL